MKKLLLVSAFLLMVGGMPATDGYWSNRKPSSGRSNLQRQKNLILPISQSSPKDLPIPILTGNQFGKLNYNDRVWINAYAEIANSLLSNPKSNISIEQNWNLIPKTGTYSQTTLKNYQANQNKPYYNTHHYGTHNTSHHTTGKKPNLQSQKNLILPISQSSPKDLPIPILIGNQFGKLNYNDRVWINAYAEIANSLLNNPKSNISIEQNWNLIPKTGTYSQTTLKNYQANQNKPYYNTQHYSTRKTPTHTTGKKPNTHNTSPYSNCVWWMKTSFETCPDRCITLTRSWDRYKNNKYWSGRIGKKNGNTYCHCCEKKGMKPHKTKHRKHHTTRKKPNSHRWGNLLVPISQSSPRGLPIPVLKGSHFENLNYNDRVWINAYAEIANSIKKNWELIPKTGTYSQTTLKNYQANHKKPYYNTHHYGTRETPTHTTGKKPNTHNTSPHNTCVSWMKSPSETCSDACINLTRSGSEEYKNNKYWNGTTTKQNGNTYCHCCKKKSMNLHTTKKKPKSHKVSPYNNDNGNLTARTSNTTTTSNMTQIKKSYPGSWSESCHSCSLNLSNNTLTCTCDNGHSKGNKSTVHAKPGTSLWNDNGNLTAKTSKTTTHETKKPFNPRSLDGVW